MTDEPEATADLFDEDGEGDGATVVDTSFWNQPKVPDYPPLAHFGRFEILGRLARGGMAEVYLAREWDEQGRARHLVVKRILPEMRNDERLMKMFLDEGNIATRLYHQNVCHVYECGEIDGDTFMALEWVWGPSLHTIIERIGGRGSCIPWPVAVEICAQIAGALHYVHNAKGVGGKALSIVHRDVSPHNVMLSWSGAVKLLDFGIAKTSTETTTGGATVGKYGYMSPEQAQSQRVDARSDIFSLGVVLFEALTGKALYDRPTLLATLTAVVREPVPSLSTERPELPESLDQIVQRALAKDPAHRFQSAGELGAALRQMLRSGGHIVSQQRIALFLDGLFKGEEKEPLYSGSRKLTGSFAALTEEGALAALGGSAQFVQFSHDTDDEPRPRTETSAGKRSGLRTALGYLGFVLLAVIMAAIGAGAAFLLMRL
ncbi:MAG: serine/threonine-protein kinase [Sandaracinaceae bacterium]